MARSIPLLGGMPVSASMASILEGTKMSSCCKLSRYMIKDFKVKQYLGGQQTEAKILERKGNGINSEVRTALCRPFSDKYFAGLTCEHIVWNCYYFITVLTFKFLKASRQTQTRRF